MLGKKKSEKSKISDIDMVVSKYTNNNMDD